MAEDEMVGWHHPLNEHEFEQVPGDGEGQGTLVGCSPRGCKESDATEHTGMKEKKACLAKLVGEKVQGIALR